MKYFYLLLVLTGISSINCYSQSNYKSGYIVNLKGDTLRGYIDYRDWGTNPEAISFKKLVSDKNDSRFTPGDIRFFNVDNLKAYRSYSGRISTDYIDPNHLEESRDTNFAIRTVFLQIIQNGPNVVYYAYADGIKTRLYFEQNDDHIINEFVYRLYNGDSPGHSVSENTYMKQLFSLANKYNVLTDNLTTDIEHLSYNTESILEIINKINHADVKQQAAKRREYNKKSTYLFAGLGVNITTTDPKSLYQQNGGKSSTSFLPRVSAGISFFTNPDTRNLVFRGELGLEGIHYLSSYQNKSYPYDNISYSYSNLVVTFTPQVLYNFYNTNSFKVYAGLGLEAALNNYSSGEYNSSAGSGYNTNNPFDFIKTNARPMIKAGITLNNKISIDVSYLSGGDVSNDPYFQLSANPIQIGINYFFGSK